VRHAYVAWHDGKVLPGCKNYANETGDKWTETTFPPLLPNLEVTRGFTDGAGAQYQQRETTHGTARCYADLGVRIYHDVHERYDFKGPWDGYGKESSESRRSAVRNRTATINNAMLHARHNAKAMARPKQGKSEARWRDYAADHYFHYYYRYGENEKGEPLADGHRHDDLLELAAEPVKSLMSYKHYEGGKTTRGVGDELGFAFTRRRLGCYCVPAAGASCSHTGWTGDLDRDAVTPARSSAAPRVAPQASRPRGPSAEFRQGINHGSLLCMPGDEDDETADGESIWFVNALGPQARCASRRRARSTAATPRATPHTPPSRLTTPRRPAVCAHAGEEPRNCGVRPMHANQEPLLGAGAVAEPPRAHRRGCGLLRLADRAGPHRRHAPHGRSRPRVGEGGGRQVFHVARAVRHVLRPAMTLLYCLWALLELRS